MSLNEIAVFGIGYVGAVSAACLAKTGFKVTATDPNPMKVNMINEGRSPIIEPGLSEIIESAVKEGQLRAISSATDAIMTTDLSLICVGTPSRQNGSLDTKYVEMVSREIGEALKVKVAAGGDYHSVVMRSTILPGTMVEIVIPILEEASGLTAGKDFGVGYYPEFLRESTAIKDYYEPGAIVFGALDETTAERLRYINRDLPVEPQVIDITAAEAVKYANNTWHAVKISYANEIGNICSAHGIDSHVVMDIVCSDTRLNISRAYMKPGFAFGGSCLPKDLRAMRHRAKQKDVPTPILDAAMEVNEYQIAKAFELIAEGKGRNIGFVGLSFKSDTDDLRESPLVDLAERLYGKGYQIKIYDPNVEQAKLNGSNKDFIDGKIPHLSALMVTDIDELLDEADTIVVGNTSGGSKNVLETLNSSDKYVVDLVRLRDELRSNGKYQGICW
ncbi:MAG: nucleotide sugar dehydrogenase [bacterium]